MSTWFRSTGDTGDIERIIGQWSGPGHRGYNLFLRNPEGDLTANVNTTNGTAQINTPEDIKSDGTWHHGVMTYDGNTFELYKDGELARTASISGDLVQGDSSTHIGGYGFDKQGFQGDADETRISAKARSGDWIRTQYNNNQKDPSNFLSIGEEVSRSDVDTNTNTDGRNGAAQRSLVARIASGGDALLVREWKELRTTYLRKRSASERKTLAESEKVLRGFQQKFRDHFSLSDTSILDSSHGKATELIETHAEQIPLELLKRQVNAYREDVNRLSSFRDWLKTQLQRVISTDKPVSLSVEEDSEQGKLTSMDGGTLKVRSDGSMSVRSLSSFDIEWRISMVKRGMEEVTASDQFTFGLVSYLADRMKRARSWMKDASASGYDRANHYLEQIERRTLSSREREASRLIQSLEWAKDYELELAIARQVAELESYRFTKPYQANRETIHTMLQNLAYVPVEFLPGVGTSEKRKRTSRILPAMRQWYNGEVRRGPERETAKLTYDFSERKQVADWKTWSAPESKFVYDEQKEAVRLSGTGLLLHDAVFAGRAKVRATAEMSDGVRNVGGVAMWTKDGGYRGMVNWRPPGDASNLPDIVPEVLQKFQIPLQNGALDVGNIRMKNLSGSKKNRPGKKTVQFDLRYEDSELQLDLDGREASSANDAQFGRGRSGLLIENVGGNVKEITMTGKPDGSWFVRKKNTVGGEEGPPGPGCILAAGSGRVGRERE